MVTALWEGSAPKLPIIVYMWPTGLPQEQERDTLA